MITPERLPKMRWWEWVLLLIGLLIFAAQAAIASPLKSAAFDEEYHIAAGYAYLKTGDFRMSTSHPPLVDSLSAIPLLFLDNIILPTDHPSWAESDYFIFSDVFLWQANDNPHEILVNGRYSIIILGTILAATLFWWARQTAGAWGGWIALVLVVTDPNLIANSRLITTDLGLTLFMTLTMWRVWRWLKRPSFPNLILVGMMAGAAMAAKFTGLMVWPMMVAIILLWHGTGDGTTSKVSHLLYSLILPLLYIGLAAYFTLWAIYRFDFGLIPDSNFPIPIPAPFYPYSLWDTFMVIEAQPKAAYLLGQLSDRGWWYYFPVALAVKTSISLLLLTAVGFYTLIKEERWRKTAVYWIPPLFFMLLAMTGRITIGYRHILPIVPFLILLAAQTGRLLKAGDRYALPLKAAIIALLSWAAISSLYLWPHQEAYFNAIAGGAAHGSEVLVDANIDWGQDLLFLNNLLTERDIDDVYLSYFGTALPEAYGIQYRPLPGFMRFTAGAEINAYNPYTPPPGWYAISETSKQLGLMLQNVDMYAYFQDKEPVACAGYSICLYEVTYPTETMVDRVVVNGRSVSDISPDKLGITNGRRVITKWIDSADVQLYPLGDGFVPPTDFRAMNADFDGAFTLIGVSGMETAVLPNTPLPYTLYWQVGTNAVDTPSPSQAAPLAAFVHLSGEDASQIIAQYDGWPTALAGLEAGDIIAQPITLFVPADAPPADYFVRVGLYSPQSGQRLPHNGQTDPLIVGKVNVSD